MFSGFEDVSSFEHYTFFTLNTYKLHTEKAINKVAGIFFFFIFLISSAYYFCAR